MTDIPDAPWIRDAEINGVPDADPVVCPVCDEECEDIYLDRNGDVCGCEHCMRIRDAWEWMDEMREVPE